MIFSDISWQFYLRFKYILCRFNEYRPKSDFDGGFNYTQLNIYDLEEGQYKFEF